jgi:hypothetical protein
VLPLTSKLLICRLPLISKSFDTCRLPLISIVEPVLGIIVLTCKSLSIHKSPLIFVLPLISTLDVLGTIVLTCKSLFIQKSPLIFISPSITKSLDTCKLPLISTVEPVFAVIVSVNSSLLIQIYRLS